MGVASAEPKPSRWRTLIVFVPFGPDIHVGEFVSEPNDGYGIDRLIQRCLRTPGETGEIRISFLSGLRLDIFLFFSVHPTGLFLLLFLLFRLFAVSLGECGFSWSWNGNLLAGTSAVGRGSGVSSYP